MRKVWIVLSLSLLMLFTVGCAGGSGAETTQTNIPAIVTEASTAIGPSETATIEFTLLAELTSTPPNGKSSASGLNIKLGDIKNVMRVTQQFEFTDGIVDDKPASIAKLTATSAAHFPAFGNGFSAVFIGNPENLAEIKITVPRTEDQSTANSGVGMMTMMFVSILPTDVQAQFLTWVNLNYLEIPVGGSKETILKNFKFTLSRTSTEMLLDIIPAT